MRVTDLEKFTKEQIYNPYMSSLSEDRFIFTLDDVAYDAENHPEWWAMVVSRLHKMNVNFAFYVKHEIVDLVNDSCGVCGASPMTANCNNAGCDV